jgi:hypothetical protein
VYTPTQKGALDAIRGDAAAQEIDRRLLDVHAEHRLRRDARHIAELAARIATNPIPSRRLHSVADLMRQIRVSLEEIA